MRRVLGERTSTWQAPLPQLQGEEEIANDLFMLRIWRVHDHFPVDEIRVAGLIGKTEKFVPGQINICVHDDHAPRLTKGCARVRSAEGATVLNRPRGR